MEGSKNVNILNDGDKVTSQEIFLMKTPRWDGTGHGYARRAFVAMGSKCGTKCPRQVRV